MSFLTISDGSTTLTVDVETTSANENEPDRVGSSDRTFSGNYLSSVSRELRNFSFVIPQMTEAEYQALRTLVQRDQRRTIAGDAIGSTITARVRIKQSAFNDDTTRGGYFTRAASIDISEG